MELSKMTKEDITEVAKLYTELIYFVEYEAKDEYFQFDKVSENELEKQLKESIGKPELISFIAKEDGNIIAFISGELKECFLPLSNIKKQDKRQKLL